jgi:hypothetical protein
MKKTFLAATLVLVWVSHTAFKPHKDFDQLTITSLVVNADVSIVLTNETTRPVNLVGDSIFMQQVLVSQNAGSLRINSTKKKDFRRRGILYIPAANLREIVINNCSKISSVTILPIPSLKLTVNGECEVDIMVTGNVELSGNDSYEIDYRSRVLPTAMPVASKQKRQRERLLNYLPDYSRSGNLSSTALSTQF